MRCKAALHLVNALITQSLLLLFKRPFAPLTRGRREHREKEGCVKPKIYGTLFGAEQPCIPVPLPLPVPLPVVDQRETKSHLAQRKKAPEGDFTLFLYSRNLVLKLVEGPGER